jgi:hypothetical protein
LEIDHINPKKKRIDMSLLAGMSKAKLEAEIIKCQLLCRACHTAKSILDAGNKPARGTHGTLSSRRYCNCRECKDAFNAWQRKRRIINAVQMRAKIISLDGPAFKVS